MNTPAVVVLGWGWGCCAWTLDAWARDQRGEPLSLSGPWFAQRSRRDGDETPLRAVLDSRSKHMPDPAQHQAPRSGRGCHHGCSATEGRRPSCPDSSQGVVVSQGPALVHQPGVCRFLFRHGFLLQGVWNDCVSRYQSSTGYDVSTSVGL